MKRSTILLLFCGQVLLVGCDRREACIALLNAGFNAENVATALDAEPVETILLSDELVTSPLLQLVRDLDALREIGSDSQGEQAERMATLVDRIHRVAASCELDKNLSPAMIQQVRAASQTADRMAAGRGPMRGPMQASIQRFVTNFLIRETVTSATVEALYLHAAMHPDCETNVDLYLTVVDRLENEGQGAAAEVVARDGISRCVGHADIGRLETKLERLLQGA